MDKEIKIRDLQLAQLDILQAFINVCKELNLKYFLDCGTLLGCIRHNGFIPWDDDVDVCMPRGDYEIFLEKGQDILEEKYFIQTYNTDKEYTQNFAKIRNSETTFIESSVKDSNINHGIYIDIFPFDGYRPKNKIRNMINSKKYILYNVQIQKKYTISYISNTFKNKIICKLSDIIYSKKSMTKILEIKEKIAKKYKYETSEYICSYFCEEPPPERNYIPREYFDKTTIKLFEDIEVSVPENYDAYLKRLYGDYMKLPPEKDRKPHHYNEIIDLNKSYKEYLNTNTKEKIKV